jgi:hypothetical protein
MNKTGSLSIAIDLESAVRGIEAQAQLRERRSRESNSSDKPSSRPTPADNRIDDEVRHLKDKGRLLDIVA